MIFKRIQYYYNKNTQNLITISTVCWSGLGFYRGYTGNKNSIIFNWYSNRENTQLNEYENFECMLCGLGMTMLYTGPIVKQISIIYELNKLYCNMLYEN